MKARGQQLILLSPKQIEDRRRYLCHLSDISRSCRSDALWNVQTDGTWAHVHSCGTFWFLYIHKSTYMILYTYICTIIYIFTSVEIPDLHFYWTLIYLPYLQLHRVCWLRPQGAKALDIRNSSVVGIHVARLGQREDPKGVALGISPWDESMPTAAKKTQPWHVQQWKSFFDQSTERLIHSFFCCLANAACEKKTCCSIQTNVCLWSFIILVHFRTSFTYWNNTFWKQKAKLQYPRVFSESLASFQTPQTCCLSRGW